MPNFSPESASDAAGSYRSPNGYPLVNPSDYPGQPVLPPYPASQMTPPVYPGQPAPGVKAKSRRGLIVILCTLLIVTVCALGITLYLLLRTEESLTVGVKPAWENPATVELDSKGEPGLSYTLHWTNKDQLILVQPFKDGSGIGQLLDPKTGHKTGTPIVLAKCGNSLKYPYQIKDGKIVCATTETIKTNQNKKYQFKEQIYTDKHLVVGASPTASNARQISAYNPKTSKLLWVQNLKEPASVTCNGKKIYTTTPPQKSGSGEKQKLKVMVYTGSSQAQESPEKQLDGSKTNSPEQTKPEIAKDAIKKIDFANAYIPTYGLENCSDQNFWYKADYTPISRKMPGKTTPCWATMKNGKSVETIPSIAGTGERMVAADMPPMPMEPDKFFDLSSFTPDSSKPYTIAYGDVNGDGYLDAMFITQNAESGEFTLAILDPKDPEHPYLSMLDATMDPRKVKIVSPGKLAFYYPASTSPSGRDQVIVEISITGYEITNYVKHTPSAG